MAAATVCTSTSPVASAPDASRAIRPASIPVAAATEGTICSERAVCPEGAVCPRGGQHDTPDVERALGAYTRPPERPLRPEMVEDVGDRIRGAHLVAAL